MPRSASGSPGCGPTATSSGPTSASTSHSRRGDRRGVRDPRPRAGAAAHLRACRQAVAEVPRRHRARRLPLPLLPRARAARTRTSAGPEAIEVNVLVHGDYILTVHREDVSLPEILPSYSPEGRSEQYVVYVVLDGMVATAFDALSATELALEGLQVMAGEAGNARVRAGTLRAISLRLTKMRRPARAAAREGSSGSARRSARSRADRRQRALFRARLQTVEPADRSGSTPPPTRWRR